MSERYQAPRPPRTVLLLADGTKSAVEELWPKVKAWLEERGLSVEVRRDVRAFSGASCEERRALSEPRPDLVVVLGGDGSVLAAVRLFAEEPVAVVGINLGRVGFLAPVHVKRWRDALEEVFEGRAKLEPRMMLEAEFDADGALEGEGAVALNDVVLGRGQAQGMVTIRLFVEEERVGDYRTDALIFATPSGSTAYSLAAGGPILAPHMEGIVVTPVAAHVLSCRPIVLHPASLVEAQVLEAPGRVTLAIDGHPHGELAVGERLRVRRHPNSYPLLAPLDSDPWMRLRERLGWRGSLFEATPPLPAP